VASPIKCLLFVFLGGGEEWGPNTPPPRSQGVGISELSNGPLQCSLPLPAKNPPPRQVTCCPNFTCQCTQSGTLAVFSTSQKEGEWQGPPLKDVSPNHNGCNGVFDRDHILRLPPPPRTRPRVALLLSTATTQRRSLLPHHPAR